MGVYRRGKVWWIRLGYAGQEIRQRGGLTRSEAERTLSELRRTLETGGIPETPLKSATFGEIGDVYLEYCRANKASRTVERDTVSIVKHLTPYFRKRLIVSLHTIDIEQYKQVRSRYVAPGTVNRELTTLKAMLRKAVEWGYLRYNPASSVGKLPDPISAPKSLLPEECLRLLRSCRKSRNRSLYPFVATALYAGLRKSELFHLTWNDIDTKRGIILVGNKDGWHTKNYADRTVPMPLKLRRILGHHPPHSVSPYVFYNPDGSRFHDIRGSFDKAVVDANLPRLTFHILRHTYASLLVMNGKDLPTVQHLLGHADIKTTMRYAHMAPDHIIKAVEDFDFGDETGAEEVD
jgi:integrase